MGALTARKSPCDGVEELGGGLAVVHAELHWDHYMQERICRPLENEDAASHTYATASCAAEVAERASFVWWTVVTIMSFLKQTNICLKK